MISIPEGERLRIEGLIRKDVRDSLKKEPRLPDWVRIMLGDPDTGEEVSITFILVGYGDACAFESFERVELGGVPAQSWKIRV